MKRIIDISEEDYNFLIEHKDEYNYERTRIAPILNSIPLNECKAEDCISRKQAQDEIYWKCQRWSLSKASNCCGQDVWNDYMISSKDAMQVLKDLPTIYPKSDKSVLEDIKAEIEQVKKVMNEEIIDHDRKDLINFVNGLNQCLCILDKHISGKENHDTD